MTLSTIETVIGHWVTVIKAHEKLLLAILLAGTVLHFGDKAYDAYGQYLKNKQTADDAKIATLQAQNDASVKALAALVADVDARFKADEAKIQTAKTTIVVQQKKNDAMTPPELYTHWQSVLALPEGNIKPQEDGTAIVSLDAAHQTVNEIDKVAPLTDQLIATQDELKGCTDIRTAQEKQISNDGALLAAEKQGRADDAKEAKHQQRKSYLRGLKHGIIIGVAGTTAAIVAIFH